MIYSCISSLVLGTAQLGFPYGIANKKGQPDRKLAIDIIQTAWDNGIREFDTAQDYGESEKVLGSVFAEIGLLAEAGVITKIDPDLDHCNPHVMSKALDESIRKLRVPYLSGLMLHNEDMLNKWPNGLGDILAGFVAEGKVKKIGVSVYSPGKALEALGIAGIDIIQLPSNMLDRRFEKNNVFELAAETKKQVYIRSVFLQGLILMDPEDLPEHMSLARPVLDKVKLLSQELNLTKHEIALGYLKEKFPDAKLIIGADNPEQILENIKYWKRKPVHNIITLVSEYFDDLDERILNPSLWSSKA
jgi:aryl-alcohol dehydrogenase-like predicted oxidoreductase